MDNLTNFGLDNIRMPFYCLNIPSKTFYGSIGAEFLTLSRVTSKTDDLSRTCKQLLIKIDPTAPKSFY